MVKILTLAILMTGLVLGFNPGAQAAVYSDGSIFLDQFDGTALDSSNWSSSAESPSLITVADGKVNLDSVTGGGNFVMESIAALNYGALTEWASEIRFKITELGPLSQGLPTGDSGDLPREVILFGGNDGGSGWGTWEDFTFTLLEEADGDANEFTLGWRHRTDATPEVLAANVARDAWHRLTAYTRSDGQVEIWLDDSLVATKTSLGGQPNLVRVRDASSSVATNLTIDYVAIGAATTTPIPEPTSILLLGTGILGIVGFLRNKRFRV